MRIGAGTRAMITGASRGIGRETALELAKRGATVGLVARGAEGVEKLAAEIGELAVPLPADITDRTSIAKAVAELVERAGGLEIVVANAGIVHYGPFLDQPPEYSDEMVRLNVLGTIDTVRAALEPMIAAGSGHVVVVSSGAGLRAFPWGAVYGATKAANKGFAEGLRHELSGTGVSVSTVYPGEVKTSIHDHQLDKIPDWRKWEDAIDADEVAGAVISAIENDRREVYVPRNVRMLGLNGIAPGLVDRLLRRARGGAAAPRNY